MNYNSVLSEDKQSNIPFGSAAASSAFYAAASWCSCADGLDLFPCLKGDQFAPSCFPTQMWPRPWAEMIPA